jgi:hypothetical protein
MMFIMQTNIISKEIQRAVIRVCLRDESVGERILSSLRWVEDVVLSDKMASTGVKRTGKEGGEDQVVETMHRASLDKDEIEKDLDSNVDEMDLGKGNFVDEYRAEGVEEDLEGAEESLSS